MANTKHVNIFGRGLAAWNEWRRQYPRLNPDLSAIDLGHRDLRGINFSHTNLTRVNFSRANLSEAIVSNADLGQANLTAAILTRVQGEGANFRRAVLREANFFRAHLRGADFRGSDLTETDFSQAQLGGTDLSGAEIVNTTFTKSRMNNAVIRRANLTGANFSRVQMNKITLFGCNLSDANLAKANLSWSSLSRANLTGANLSDAVLKGTNLSGSQLTNADLTGADLSYVRLIDVDLEDANISGCTVFGISAWNVKTNRTDQSNLRITRQHEPRITVDNVEVAQFIYLLLNHEKLRTVIDSITERGVLILGRFGGGGLDVLYSIAAKLRELDYLPIVFDFPRPEDRNYTETVKTLVGLSRFVIADLSGPSVPQELTATVPHFKIPFVTIMEKGKRVYSMFSDILEYPWVLPPVEYESVSELISMIPSQVCDVAEEQLKERQALLKTIFVKR
jgi:uncharacterized protein YjbI with pentapeptide repeats